MNKTTWKEKLDILIIYPNLSIKQIQKVFDLGQPQAIEIRSKAKKLAKRNGRYIAERKVPTDLVLEVMGLDYDFFKKMVHTEKGVESERFEAWHENRE